MFKKNYLGKDYGTRCKIVLIDSIIWNIYKICRQYFIVFFVAWHDQVRAVIIHFFCIKAIRSFSCDTEESVTGSESSSFNDTISSFSSTTSESGKRFSCSLFFDLIKVGEQSYELGRMIETEPQIFKDLLQDVVFNFSQFLGSADISSKAQVRAFLVLYHHF